MVDTEAVSVPSQGSTVAGTIFRPSGVKRPPVVVMGPGFAARRSWGLQTFGRRFAEAGLAALAFDYRGFGESTGGPRRVISSRKQLADYRAVIDLVRDRSDLGDDVGLWGTSFSGGHVLELGATEDVDAIVSMVPVADGPQLLVRLLQYGGVDFARCGVESIARDAAHILLSRDPYYIPVVTKGDEFAFMTAPDAKAGFESIIPPEDRDEWANRVAARVLADLALYRPVTDAPDIDAPVFVLQATDDQLVPKRSIDDLVIALDDVERVKLPGGHFDGLVGATGNEVAKRQAQFLTTHLD